MSVEWDERFIDFWENEHAAASQDNVEKLVQIVRAEHTARLDAEARRDGWKLDAEANLRRYERLAYDYEILAVENNTLTENIERALKILNDIPAIFDSLEYDGVGNNINEAIAILMGLKND